MPTGSGFPLGRKVSTTSCCVPNPLDDFVVKEPGGYRFRLRFVEPAELVSPAQAGEFQSGFTQGVRSGEDRGRLRVSDGRAIGDFHDGTLPRVDLRPLRRNLVKGIDQERHEFPQVEGPLEPKDPLDNQIGQASVATSMKEAQPVAGLRIIFR